jgi:hypothetical protein
MGEMGLTRLFLVASVSVALASAAACSSSSDSTFGDKADGGDGGEPPPISPLVPDSSAEGGGDAGPKQCNPVIPADFKPKWVAPTKMAACSPEELQGYWDACLKDASKKEPCAAYTTAHAACVACIEPPDKSGPVQWHQNRMYYTLNVAGCIAIEQNKMGETDCGGAYNAAVQCTRESCQQCFDTGGTFNDFRECQNKVSMQGICKSYQTVQSNTCQGIKDADAGTLQCFQNNNESLETLFVRVEGIFCGQ